MTCSDRFSLRLQATMFCLLISLQAFAAPPAGFDTRVETVRKAAGVPGVAIAIVEHGNVTLAKGYGVRELGKPEPVDGDTLFLTASTGKAFTVAGLAILVDQGKIGWDDAVIEHIPWFRMYDPWVTREITVRDLLVHWSGLGLGAGDLLWLPRTNRSRVAAIESLRYLKPATSFRSGYAYDNVLYMVAGQLVEEVTGQTWEAFTSEHVLQAAGMKNSTADEPRRIATPNRAQPHARISGELIGTGRQQVLDERDQDSRIVAPAGGLAISANDSARWLLIQLAHGALPEGGGRLFSEQQSKEMWAPVVVQPITDWPENLDAIEPNFSAYALGWDVEDYRGAELIWHGGATDGFRSAVVLLPEKAVGFSIFINAQEGSVVRGLMYELLDHYLDRPEANWPEKLAAYVKAQTAEKVAEYKQARPATGGPSLPLERYAGDYEDPWYGEISIVLDEGRLLVDFRQTPRMTATLEHWQYDTFVAPWTDKTIEPAYLTFQLDADGAVERITMKAVSPLADFSYDFHDLLFTRAGSKEARK